MLAGLKPRHWLRKKTTVSGEVLLLSSDVRPQFSASWEYVITWPTNLFTFTRFMDGKLKGVNHVAVHQLCSSIPQAAILKASNRVASYRMQSSAVSEG